MNYHFYFIIIIIWNKWQDFNTALQKCLVALFCFQKMQNTIQQRVLLLYSGSLALCQANQMVCMVLYLELTLCLIDYKCIYYYHVFILTAVSPIHNIAFDKANIKEDVPTSPAINKVPLPHPVSFNRHVSFNSPVTSHLFRYTSYICLLSFLKSIRKKSVTLQHVPSAVFHYSDSGGHSSHIQHCKVNAIFQAAKKDLLKIFQLQVRPHFIHNELWSF